MCKVTFFGMILEKEFRGIDIMSDHKQLGFIILVLTMIISLYFIFNSAALLPSGYSSAIDGYIISRSLFIIFILYIIAKVGFIFLTKKD